MIGWRDLVKRRLDDLVTLPPNWDSYGSPPVKRETADHMQSLFDSLNDLDDIPYHGIYPISGGGLQIEMKHEGRFLQIEYIPDLGFEFLMLQQSLKPATMEGTFKNVIWARELIAWLCRPGKANTLTT